MKVLPVSLPRFCLFVLTLLVGLGSVGCQVLRPPRTTPRAVYTVKSGDTVSSVAERYRVPLASLLKVNRLTSLDFIQPGDRLLLPQDYLDSPTPFDSPNVSSDLLNGASHFVGSLSWPLEHIEGVNSNFGKRWSSFHEGVDLPGSIGTPIHAAHEGKVVYSGKGMKGYGNLVVIQNGSLMTAYAHNRKNHVRVGAQVQKGQKIAEIGMTGRVTGPHLHFETRVKNSRGKYVAINPMIFFTGEQRKSAEVSLRENS